MVRKVKKYVEVSDKNIYLWLPANKQGYKIFLQNGGTKKYESLFKNTKKNNLKNF